MLQNGQAAGWWVCVLRMPAEPSRHRVAAWRELRRGGAVQIGQGCWAVPSLPVFAPMIERVGTLARDNGGELVVLDAVPHDDPSRVGIETAWTTSRTEEWTEFNSDCHKLLAALDRQTTREKYTLAELEEQELSMERLRRWHRDLQIRDVLTTPIGTSADELFGRCEAALEAYTNQVYSALESR